MFTCVDEIIHYRGISDTKLLQVGAYHHILFIHMFEIFQNKKDPPQKEHCQWEHVVKKLNKTTFHNE